MSNFRTFVCEIVTVHGWYTRIHTVHASEVQDKTGKGNAAKNLDRSEQSSIFVRIFKPKGAKTNSRFL